MSTDENVTFESPDKILQKQTNKKVAISYKVTKISLQLKLLVALNGS